MRPSAQPFLWKWVLFAWEWKIIFISTAERLTSFWYRGPGELGNGLFKPIKTIKNSSGQMWQLYEYFADESTQWAFARKHDTFTRENNMFYYMAESVFPMRLVNSGSVTCYTDQNFKENAHFGALNLFTSQKKVEIKLQDVCQPWGLRFWLCPSTF